MQRSSDDGATWQALGGPGEAVALIATDARDGQHLMAVGGTGQVYWSRDAGKS